MAINIEDNDIVYNIDITLSDKPSTKAIFTKQYDNNSRYIVASLWKNDERYIIPPNTTVMFCATKPSGLGIADTENCEIVNNKIIYRITEQVTIESGAFFAEFRLLKEQDNEPHKISHPRIRILVEKSSLDNKTIISSESFNILDELIEQAENAISELDELNKYYNDFKIWEDYNDDKIYKEGNKVYYKGSSYICKENIQGIPPTNVEYWQIIALKGQDGIGSGDGGGDMYKYVYDTNDNGIVDNAEKVNGYTVNSDVPSGAKFTDTITSINDKVGIITKEDIVALGIPEQDTVYIHPEKHSPDIILQDSNNRFVTDIEKNKWNTSINKEDVELALGYSPADKLDVGDKISLSTTDKSNLVSAINEIKANASDNGNEIVISNNNLTSHISDLTKHKDINLEFYRTNKDSDGVYRTLQWKRKDNTLAIDSSLSGSPKYTTRTETYYDLDGVTILITKTYTINYDNDDEFISEV